MTSNEHHFPPPADPSWHMVDADASASGLHAPDMPRWLASMPLLVGPPTLNWQPSEPMPPELLDVRQDSFAFHPLGHSQPLIINGAPPLTSSLGLHHPALFQPMQTTSDGYQGSPAISHHSSVTVDAQLAAYPYTTQAQSPLAPTSYLSSPPSPGGSSRQSAAYRPPGGTSKFKGVTKHKHTSKWEAHLWDSAANRKGMTKTGRTRGRQIYLGGYETEEQAARAYDQAAIVYWGASAKLNFKLSDYQAELPRLKSMNPDEIVQELRRQSASFSRGESKFKGVMRDHHNRDKWEARTGRGKGSSYKFLGVFETEAQAAAAYDHAALSDKGSSSSKLITNFPSKNYYNPTTNELLPLSQLLAVCDTWRVRSCSASPQSSPARPNISTSQPASPAPTTSEPGSGAMSMEPAMPATQPVAATAAVGPAGVMTGPPKLDLSAVLDDMKMMSEAEFHYEQEYLISAGLDDLLADEMLY